MREVPVLETAALEDDAKGASVIASDADKSEVLELEDSTGAESDNGANEVAALANEVEGGEVIELEDSAKAASDNDPNDVALEGETSGDAASCDAI